MLLIVIFICKIMLLINSDDVLSNRKPIISTLLMNESLAICHIVQKVNYRFNGENKASIKLLSPLVLHNFSDTMTTLCSSIQLNQWPLLGNMDLPLGHNVETFLRHFRLPFVTWDAITKISRTKRIGKSNPNISSQLPFENDCHVFSLQPDLLSPLTDFLVQWKWRKFAYIYTSEEQFNRIQRVLGLLNNRYHYHVNVDMVFLPVQGNASFSINTLLHLDRRLSKLNQRNIIVDIFGKKQIFDFFHYLRLLGMIRREYHYLIVDFVISELNLNDLKESHARVSGFEMVNRQYLKVQRFLTTWVNHVTKHHVASILDSISVVNRLFSISSNSIFYHNYHFDIPACCKTRRFASFKNHSSVQNSNNASEIIAAMKAINFMGYTGPVAFDSLTCRRKDFTLMLSALYKGNFFKSIAHWSNANRWFTFSNNRNMFPFISTDKTQDSNGLINSTFRVVTILTPPYLYYRKDVKGKPMSGKQNFEGYCKDLMELLSERLGIKYEIYLVRDGKYGGYNKHNRSWNGIVGEIIRREADIAIAPLTVTTYREKVIDFSEPFMTFGLSIMIRKPLPTKAGAFNFLLPLSNEVWFSIVIGYFAVSASFYFIARCSPFGWKSNNPKVNFNMGNCLWFNFASFMQQGVDYSPVSTGARILTSFWWLFSLLIMAFYTATLVSFLSVEKVISPISKINDLIHLRESHGIRFGTVHSGSTKMFFASAKHHPFEALYNMLQNSPDDYAHSIAEGVRRVRENLGTYAFITESKTVEFINYRQPCNTMRVGQIFNNNAYAVALPTNNSFFKAVKKRINIAILTLREEQVLAKLYRKWWIEHGECIDVDSHGVTEPLALINVSGAFYVLFFGTILSLLVPLYDTAKYYLRKHCIKKT